MTRHTRRCVAAGLLALAASLGIDRGMRSVGASLHAQTPGVQRLPGPVIVETAGTYHGEFYVPSPKAVTGPSQALSTWVITYTGAFTPQAKVAIQAAADIWSSQI